MTVGQLHDRRRAPAVLVVVGASGAGKSTLIRALAALELPGVTSTRFGQ